MKKNNLLLFLFFLLGISLISWQKTEPSQRTKFQKSLRHNSGAPTAKTGAPGETNCTVCHLGSVQTGTNENQFLLTNSSGAVTHYLPNETYQIELSMASNPAKKGMQVTVLNSSNQFVGSFTPATGGVNFTMAGGRSYANHTAASTLATFPFWTWNWTAPATDEGPVTFYVATNLANANGQNSGDVIHLSNHTIGSTMSLKENSFSAVGEFNASFSPENSMIYLQYASLISGSNFVNIVDMTGKSVLNMKLGTSTIGTNKESIRVPDHLKNGAYIVQFFVDNYPMSQSVVIER